MSLAYLSLGINAAGKIAECTEVKQPQSSYKWSQE